MVVISSAELRGNMKNIKLPLAAIADARGIDLLSK